MTKENLQKLKENIPPELKQRHYWCVWKYVTKPGKTKPDKVPYNPLTAQPAKSDNPNTFAAFTVAEQTLGEKSGYDGAGVGIFDDLSAVDIDDCIDQTGQINELARDVISTMNTYMEISPSGKGLRLFFFAPGFRYDKARYYIINRKAGLEIFIAGITKRFVTVTGNIYGFPLPIADCSATLPLVLEKYMRRPKCEKIAPAVTTPGSILTDDEVLAKAHRPATAAA